MDRLSSRRKPFAAAALRPLSAQRPAVFVIVLTAMAVLITASVAVARPAPASFADLAEQVTPAVVNIATVQKSPMRFMSHDGAPGLDRPMPVPPDSPFGEFFRRFFEGQPGPFGAPGAPSEPGQKPRALGSGFIIDPDGHVVTNNHVIANAEEIEVVLADGTRYPARLVGRDAKTDLALLKIDAPEPLPHVAFGDSDRVRVGDWVLAVGNPFGLGGSVTAGIVSARGRDLQGGTIVDFLQIDAPINRGNSGGPTFNDRGEVIGVNTAIFSPNGGSVGIGFAVPSNIAKTVVADLRDDGRVSRGWLGVRIQPVTEDLAEGFGLAKPRGTLLSSVEPKSPAAAAGLRSGDIILGWNGKAIESPSDLARQVALTESGKTVPVTLWRNGAETTLSVTVGSSPDAKVRADAAPGTPSPGAAERVPAGMTVADLSPELRRSYSVPKGVEGVLVTGVQPGSPAARQGLRRGDVITGAALAPVEDVDALADRLEAARKAGRTMVALEVVRGGESRFVALPVARA